MTQTFSHTSSWCQNNFRQLNLHFSARNCSSHKYKCPPITLPALLFFSFGCKEAVHEGEEKKLNQFCSLLKSFILKVLLGIIQIYFFQSSAVTVYSCDICFSCPFTYLVHSCSIIHILFSFSAQRFPFILMNKNASNSPSTSFLVWNIN